MSRVTLDRPLAQLIQDISTRFDLGTPNQYELIEHGYQDVNVRLIAASGQQYLVKIFSKRRTLTNIQDQIRTLVFLASNGIPVPHLVHCEREPLIEVADPSGTAYVCVMEYFEGHDFEKIPPSQPDIVYLAGCLSRIHQLHFNVSRYYDDWGAANLATEFAAKLRHLSSDDLILVENILSAFSEVNLAVLRQCTIHGDLYRSHVLRNLRGEYCIIDFGCMDYNAAVLDLAIFIAHFCLGVNQTPAEITQLYNLAIDAYCAIGCLSKQELAALPILIAASYAAYIVATSSLIANAHDHSLQTQQWLAISRNKIKSFMKSGIIAV
ncbi:MAG: phosphotransferase [Candidatus Melainabacteria bacterium]|nr:phosphotransferase [Candidatus Melainabacteria bacterium]